MEPCGSEPVDRLSAPQKWEPITFGGGHSELVKQSLFNITSLSPEQVSDYALNSPLGMAMKAELLSRGVNVENYLSMIEGPETL